MARMILLVDGEKTDADEITLEGLSIPVRGGSAWFDFGDIVRVERHATGTVAVTVELADGITLDRDPTDEGT